MESLNEKSLLQRESVRANFASGSPDLAIRSILIIGDGDVAASAGLRAGRGWTRSGPPRSPDEGARAAAADLLGTRAPAGMYTEAAEVLLDARAPSRMDVEAILG